MSDVEVTLGEIPAIIPRCAMRLARAIASAPGSASPEELAVARALVGPDPLAESGGPKANRIDSLWTTWNQEGDTP